MKLLTTQFKSVLITSVALLFFSFGFLPHAFAQTYPPASMPTGTIELDGYAWSSTIGWISLNCKTGSAAGGNICGTSDYQVTINSAGNIYGYAWSSNIGWIKFGNLSQYPVDAGNPGIGGVATNSPARVTGTYPALTFAGWARACAGTLSGVDACSNMSSRTDDWDGWISLKGSTYSISTKSDGTMNPNSYAWGSTNVGWVNWSTASGVKWAPVSAIMSCTAMVNGATTSNCTCTIDRGSNSCPVLLAWQFSPLNIKSPSVYLSTTTPVVISTSASSSQSLTIKYGTTNTYKADTGGTTLASKNLGATCETADIFSTTTNKCIFNASSTVTTTLTTSNKIVRIGGSVDLTWSVTGVPDMSKCKLTGPGVPGNYFTSATPLSDSLTVTGVKNFSNYTLYCANGVSTTTNSASVEVVPSVVEI
jgi:hypothetical protein